MSEDPRYHRVLDYGHRKVALRILRRRRKTMAIHVFRDKPVELRAPLKCSWIEIEAFLKSRHGWILESLEALQRLDVPAAPRYVDGEEQFFLGERLRLRVLEGRTRHVSVAGRNMIVRCTEPDNPSKVQAAIDGFYRREARRLLPGRLEICRARFAGNLPDCHISLRKMRARWGSCSREGEICLNILLMQKPTAAIDFVITHELCHLRHFGHDKGFYGLMSLVMPDWRQRENLLNSGSAVLEIDLLEQFDEPGPDLFEH